MIFYLVGATLTFSILLNAFYKDTTTSKTDVVSWLVLFVATLIWFITLPGILKKKLQPLKTASSESWAKLGGF
jgi:uncharacterized membrane protein